MAIDFQNLADGIEAPTSIMSVLVAEDGSLAELRVVTGNRAYIDSIERPAGDYQMATNKFVPNSLYTDYVPRDLNFEDFCFRSAVNRKCLHSYVKPSHMPIWFNMTFLPVGKPEGNIYYCSYSMEVNFNASTESMTNIDPDLASKVLEVCIKMRGADDFEKAMQEVISDVRELCHAEHSCVLLVDEYEKNTSILCASYSGGTRNIPARAGDIIPGTPAFYEVTRKWEELIGSSNCFIAKNESDMEVVKELAPQWYDSITVWNIKTIVIFPLKYSDELLGYIWVLNIDPAKAPEIKEALELFTFILGTEIYNYLLLKRLKVLSSKDMLTGVLNRNEMNNYVDKLSNEKPVNAQSVGVVFVDLNGLKVINDDLGHASGDKLLKDAAKALLEVYPEDSIYRAGGDEFTIIRLGVSEEELKSSISKLRDVSERYYRVSFAIGGCVMPDSIDIREALKIADKRMYEDKREYYSKKNK